MLNDLKVFLACNKRERTGIFILLSLILSVIMFNHFSPLLIKSNCINDPAMINLLDSLLKADSISKFRKDSLFYFDPNQIEKKEWMLLGLTESQARVVENYKNAGGRFFQKKDVKKLYSISDSMYLKLEPWIRISSDTIIKQKKTITSSKKIRVNINTADTSGLCMLYGVGPVFASRIASYRRLLGGFYSKNQLLEVYGMDSVRLHQFEEQILLDTTAICKLKVLSGEFREILSHPYFSYELTVFIFNHRQEIRKEGSGYLLKFDQMNDSLFQKIIPYLSLK